MDEDREYTAGLLFEAETGKPWKNATPEERELWLGEADEFHSILGSPRDAPK